MNQLLSLITRTPGFADLRRGLAAPHTVGGGVVGSSTTLVAGAIAQDQTRPVLLIVAHLDDADEATDELSGLSVTSIKLPALESLPGEADVSLELFAERIVAVRAALALQPDDPTVLVCPIQALMQLVPEPERLGELSMAITPGHQISPQDLARWLDGAGYRRADAIDEPGDFALRGGILDVFPPGIDAEPVRLDFFGDEIEKITAVDPATMGSDRALDSVQFIAADPKLVQTDDGVTGFFELPPPETVVVLAETAEITEQGRGYYERLTDPRGIHAPNAVLKRMRQRFDSFVEINQFTTTQAVGVDLPFATLPMFARDVEDAIRDLGELTRTHDVRVLCQNEGERARLLELITEFAPEAAGAIETEVLYLHRGFVIEAEPRPIAIVPNHELLHRYHTRRRAVRLRAGRAMDAFLGFKPGDYVVHANHGIARFAGLKMMKPNRLGSSRGAASSTEPEEYLTLEFKGSSVLNVPATQIDLVQRYVGGFSGRPPLSTFGGKKWKGQKERVSESVRDLASELLRVRAAREHSIGVRYPADTAWQREFEAEFPYQETEDQLAALVEIKRDMSSPRPMDRLICGDVGFGKTELAIRAAFKACEFGKQVAVLVPTTILAEQHERTFAARFADYPFKVASLSRFKTGREIRQTLDAARKGHVDVVIGTHRLLSKDVHFADLGLVIVDEEQRFGVEHKEALLKLRMTVDVLTLSATPIPRTLHMSMIGLRDISSLTTPPLDRRAIVTEVVPFDADRIRRAIERELSRDGQVFFVHNRVHNIRSIASEVQALAPRARIVVAHGQMPPHELEDVMMRFIRREADILVSTTIIESGIDIPTANTMIINDADRFGLADLHQLRGRVGRYKHRAYCYLLLPRDRTMNEAAKKRLKAIEQYSMLGAGFKISMRDLEIRGAGNILGAEQSGHIAAVGYEMYCRLLDLAVRELTDEADPSTGSATTIDIGLGGTIPRAYIPSDQRRLEAYRRLATTSNADEVESVRTDLTDAYGKPPRAVEKLLDLAELRVAASTLGVRTITVRDRDVIFRTTRPTALVAALNGTPNSTVREVGQPAPGAPADVYFRPPENYLVPDTLVTVLRKRLAEPAAVH